VPAPWIDNPGHRDWLDAEAGRLLDFYLAAADFGAGGFWELGDTGLPDRSRAKELWINARLVHCFALGHLLGRPGCAALAEHGLDGLRRVFHDPEYGGWFWTATAAGPEDARKQTYGHAFVLLAASTAAQAGFGSSDLIAEATQLIATRFFEPASQLYTEGWDRAFTASEEYRGQNPNMHLVEAFMAAAEATGDRAYLARAVPIAERIIHEFAAGDGWRIPEHFTPGWQPRPDFHRDQPRDVLRPYGYTPGHSLEWARLLIQLRAQLAAPLSAPLGTPPGDGHDWMLDAARHLFTRAVADGWDSERTGFVYTVDEMGSVSVGDRFHWVTTEAIGAAAYLYRATGDRVYDDWYRRFWDHAALYLIDRRDGSWRHELTPDNQPGHTTWRGKPDLYHALQATLFARTPLSAGLAANLADQAGRAGQARE
jgi:mannose/cellobiose epimerase-like protein (N-acyl-D-glucosamine 2-epimerase family)